MPAGFSTGGQCEVLPSDWRFEKQAAPPKTFCGRIRPADAWQDTDVSGEPVSGGGEVVEYAAVRQIADVVGGLPLSMVLMAWRSAAA